MSVKKNQIELKDGQKVHQHNSLIEVGERRFNNPALKYSIWKSFGISKEPNSVWINGTLGTRVYNFKAVNEKNEWSWTSGTLFICTEKANDTTNIEIRHLDQIFNAIQKNYITIENITFTKGFGVSDAMVAFDGVNGGGIGYTIQNCIISDAEKMHLQFRGTSNSVINNNSIYSSFNPDIYGTIGIMSGNFNLPNWYAFNLLVYNNTIHDLRYGVLVYYANGATIHTNIIYTMTGAALSCMLSSGNNRIYRNRIFNVCRKIDDTNAIQVGTGSGMADTEAEIFENIIYEVYQDKLSGSGIMLDISSRNCNVYRNFIYSTEGAGIHVLMSKGHNIFTNVICNTGNQSKGGICLAGAEEIDIYNNSIYDPGLYSLYLLKTSGNLGNINIKNNIFYGSTSYALYLDSDEDLFGDIIIDFNDWYFSFGKMADWSGKEYDSLTNWQIGEKQDRNSISVNPLLNNPRSNDLTLTAISPCIDAGVDLGFKYKMALQPASIWPSAILIDDQYYDKKWDLGAYIFRK
jgi:hypothetical protein